MEKKIDVETELKILLARIDNLMERTDKLQNNFAVSQSTIAYSKNCADFLMKEYKHKEAEKNNTCQARFLRKLGQFWEKFKTIPSYAPFL